MKRRLFAAIFALASLCTHAPAQGKPALTVDESTMRIVPAGNRLALDLHLAAAQNEPSVGIHAELVDTYGNVRSHADATCAASPATHLCHLVLPPATSGPYTANEGTPDIALFRLRYAATSATAKASGTVTLEHIAPALFELHVVAPERVRPGGTYTIHIRALHPLTGAPSAHQSLHASISAEVDAAKDEGTEDDVTTGRTNLTTNANGFATYTFTAPSMPKLHNLTFNLHGLFGNLRIATEQEMPVPPSNQFQLATDKPLYQPGQTVHTRMLLVDRRGQASAREPVAIEVHDPDSTLVYRAKAVTSQFGIATVDWPVPVRMRLGTYQLRAHAEHGSEAYASLRLSRYDLPTFAVVPKPDRSFYLPGQNAFVDVRADYLFGRPVTHGHVRVVREDERIWNYREQRYDVKEGKAVEGELDESGSFLAHIDLAEDEKRYSDEDFSNDFEDIHLAAYVTDASSGRTEQRRFDVRITSQALHVYLAKDRQGTRGLPEQGYITVTSADGTPVACDLDLRLLPHEPQDHREPLASQLARAATLQHVRTNSLGLARLDLPTYEQLRAAMPAVLAGAVPEEREDPWLYVSARDAEGRSGVMTESIETPDEVLRITTQKPLYRAGEIIQVQVDSAESALPVTVELIRRTRHGDLLLAARDTHLQAGHAALSFPTDERFTGYVFVNVLSLRDRSGQSVNRYRGQNLDEDPIVSTSRAILFPRDNSLHVDVKMSKAVYRPGDDATAQLTAHGPQDPDGEIAEAAPTALGVVVVDQAVEERNRIDSDFGNNDNAFFFRQYSQFNSGLAGGLALGSLQQFDMKKPPSADNMLAAEILLRTLTLEPNHANTSANTDLAFAFGNVLNTELNPTRDALQKHLKTSPDVPVMQPELTQLLAQSKVDFNAIRDPWALPFTLVPLPNSYGQTTLKLHSNGADKLPGTKDDFTVEIARWSWAERYNRLLRHALESYHERTGAFIRDLPALRDEMQHEGIALDDWRDPWGQPFAYTFGVGQNYFTVSLLSNGDPAEKKSEGAKPFNVGGAQIDYFSGMRVRIENALNAYAAKHAYPMTDAEFNKAMHGYGIGEAELRDPWGHAFYATYRTHSFFTDQVHTDTHADGTAAPQMRTTVTPVTAVADQIHLRSAGPDGAQGSQDDFLLATFAHLQTEQSATDQTTVHPIGQRVHSDRSGALFGTITDRTGAAIQDANVVATNLDSHAEYEAKAAGEGAYFIDPIPAGKYKVAFNAQNFMTSVYDQVTILPLVATSLDASLNVGSVTEMVTVETQAITMDTSSASTSNLPMDNRQFYNLVQVAPVVAPPPPPSPTSTPRQRDYFPETLLWRPEVITTREGNATLHFKVADSITTWQLSASASTLEGNTGAGATQFRTFLPFFAAFDPPRILTDGDTIHLPVALRNYTDHSVTVHGELTPAPWFRPAGDTSQATEVPKQDSISPVFGFTAVAPIVVGKQQFVARADNGIGDNVVRTVTVHPNGKETAVQSAGILKAGENTFALTIPADALHGAGDTTLKLYPNLAAHLRDALTAMTAYPDGCAEQIISIAWPSMLLRRYAAAIPHPDKKLEQATQRYLEEAHENLIEDRNPDGGFGYWQNDPYSDLALTAYALQFLTQVQPFTAVDEDMVKQAMAYLTKQQTKDGLWIRVDRERKPHLEDHAANAMLTASIAAMIAGVPESETPMKKALTATQGFVEEFDEPYTLANYALTAIALKDTARSAAAIARLRAMALSENGGVYWKLETNTPFFGWGRAGRTESTAQALRALLANGATPQDDLVARGLLFLDHEQDRGSLWYSTQATARVLDVLAEIALTAKAAPRHAVAYSAQVSIDGQHAVTIPLPPAADDAGPIFLPLPGSLAAGEHRVTLTLPANAGAATAQVVSHLYQPWSATAPTSSTTNNEQLRLSVAFSTTKAAPGKPIEATAHIERIGFRGHGMLIAEIGLPPGADVDRASLESALTASGYQLNRYEVLPDRLLVYLWPKAGGFDLRFRFTPRYAIDALSAPSDVYDYYNPDARFDLAPIRFTSQP